MYLAELGAPYNRFSVGTFIINYFPPVLTSPLILGHWLSYSHLHSAPASSFLLFFLPLLHASTPLPLLPSYSFFFLFLPSSFLPPPLLFLFFLILFLHPSFPFSSSFLFPFSIFSSSSSFFLLLFLLSLSLLPLLSSAFRDSSARSQFLTTTKEREYVDNLEIQAPLNISDLILQGLECKVTVFKALLCDIWKVVVSVSIVLTWQWGGFVDTYFDVVCRSNSMVFRFVNLKFCRLSEFENMDINWMRWILKCF